MKRECDLKGCTKTFVPRTDEHRFCSDGHKNLWHARERQRILLIALAMGISGRTKKGKP
jgi:hypothetical protein